MTKEVFDWAIREAADKKQQDFSKVEFFSWEEGLCVQCMHMDPYDDEPATVAAMAKYARAQGYEADFREGRFHHEIYLSDVRRCKPERLKTVIRHPIKRAEQGETTMEIRKLRPTDDLFAVSRVYEESWREAYRGLLPQEYLDSIPLGKWVPYLGQAGRETLIILDGEKIIGAAGCCASRVPELAGWGEIASIYLLPKYWGKGWGKSLLSAAVEQLESMGYQDIFLWVLKRNQRARAFYERMGFRPSGAYAEDAIGGLPVREIQYRLERTDSLCRLPR